ncbi:hypothetical protein BDV10DRAFT_190063 [Aspergillus recurvatus]
MLRKRRVVTALIAETLLATLISSFEATIPLHIRDVFQWDSLEAGILFLVLQAPTMILVFPIGWLKDRIGMRLPVTLGFLVMAPSLWLLGVPGARQFQWAEGKTGEVLYVVMLVAIGVARTLVIGFGGVEVLRGANEVATDIPGLTEGGLSLYSRAFVLSNITWKLGMFLGPLVSGALTKSVGYYTMNFVLGEQHRSLFLRKIDTNDRPSFGCSGAMPSHGDFDRHYPGKELDLSMGGSAPWTRD